MSVIRCQQPSQQTVLTFAVVIEMLSPANNRRDFGVHFAEKRESLRRLIMKMLEKITEKSFWNLVKSNQIWIVNALFPINLI